MISIAFDGHVRVLGGTKSRRNKVNGRLLGVGTPCSACTNGEQYFPINGGAGGIERILPEGA